MPSVYQCTVQHAEQFVTRFTFWLLQTYECECYSSMNFFNDDATVTLDDALSSSWRCLLGFASTATWREFSHACSHCGAQRENDGLEICLPAINTTRPQRQPLCHRYRCRLGSV